MNESNRFSNKKTFMFQDSNGKILPHVALVVVSGMFDHARNSYVDEPNVVSGYGTCRPERVAELVGIRKPE